MASQFHRVDTSKLIRGAARIMYAPYSQARPLELNDVVVMDPAGIDEVQVVTVTGTPTGGTFTLDFDGEETATIAYNAAASAVESALEALSNVGAGNVSVAGAAGGPYTVTFTGDLGGQDVAELVLGTNALTGGTSPSVSVTTSTEGARQYDAQAGWVDLGGTREGIQITTNNTEDGFDIDQVSGIIGAAPNEWEVTVATRLAEQTLENFQIVWEGSDITEDTAPATGTEREIGFAGATSYTERRLAVLFQKSDGKVRGYLFHKVIRAPQEGVIDHRKGGEAISTQVQFRVLADETVGDPEKQHYIIRDQQ